MAIWMDACEVYSVSQFSNYASFASPIIAYASRERESQETCTLHLSLAALYTTDTDY